MAAAGTPCGNAPLCVTPKPVVVAPDNPLPSDAARAAGWKLCSDVRDAAPARSSGRRLVSYLDVYVAHRFAHGCQGARVISGRRIGRSEVTTAAHLRGSRESNLLFGPGDCGWRAAYEGPLPGLGGLLMLPSLGRDWRAGAVWHRAPSCISWLMCICGKWASTTLHDVTHIRASVFTENHPSYRTIQFIVNRAALARRLCVMVCRCG